MLKDQVLTLLGFPSILLAAFPLLFLIFFLYLVFVRFSDICLGVFLLLFILYGHFEFINLTISFPMLGKFSAMVSSNIFSDPSISLPFLVFI